MNKKLIGIFICTLVVAAVLPVTGSIKQPDLTKGFTLVNKKPITTSIGDVDWWPMFHHDIVHNGYSTSQAPNTNHVLWSRTIDNQLSYSSPVIINGKVYIGSQNGNVSCLDANDGTILWTFQTNGTIEDSSPAVANGKVYIGSDDNKVYCLNAENGTKIWEYKTGDRVAAPPTVTDGKVYIGGCDQNVYCLNADNGSKIWSYEQFGGFDITSPAVANGKVYIGSCGDHFYCLNAENGSMIWDRLIDPWGPLYASPAIYNGKVYVGSRNGGYGKISCLTAETGDWIWNYTTWGGVISSPAIYNGKIYIGSETHHVYCLNAESGFMIWVFTAGDKVRSSPAIADGKVYVGSFDKKFYCINAETGSEIWEYLTDNISVSSPAIADGMVCVGSYDGTVFMFGAPNDPPSTPTVTGPQYGRSAIEYTFTSCSHDSNGDYVFYQWTWGDGTSTDWLGPYPCNWSQSFTHQWSHDGNYNVTVKSKDVHGAESNWSRPFPFTADSEPPSMVIKKPLPSHLYVFDRFQMPFPCILAIGPITFRIDVNDTLSGVEKVIFILDNVNQSEVTTTPYEWTWSAKAFFKHKATIFVSDYANNTAEQDIEIWKFF